MYRHHKMEPSLFRAYLHIFFVVSAYWFVSISLVFLNKYLLSGEDIKLDAPLFITWFQCVVTVGLCFLFSLASKLMPNYISFSSCVVKFSTVKEIGPLSVVFVSMIIFNNLCLKYVGVSFYYVGRSLTTVFNVILSYLILNQKTSSPSIFCCAIIIFGFLLGVDQENVIGSLSVLGVIYGILASLFVALYSIYIKRVLPLVNGDVTALTYYNNLNACFLFIPLIVLFEVDAIMSFTHLSSKSFWGLMIVSGVFGFAIGYLTSLQVKVTSPLTNNISGTAKACAQTVIATLWFKEVKPLFWWISNGMVLIGSAAYTRVRQIEMAKGFGSSPPQEYPSKTDKKPLITNMKSQEV